MIYDFDTVDIVSQLTPPTKRGSVNIDWLESLIHPLKVVWTDIFGPGGFYIKERRLAIAFGGVEYIERFLQQEFNLPYTGFTQGGSSLNLIYLSDGVLNSALFFYTPAEAQPVFMFNSDEAITFMRVNEESLAVDFIVNAPVAWNNSSDKSKIGAILNRYKPAGYNYEYNFY